MQTILVAGGAGMVGSNLCRMLLQRGYRVLCVDNLITGRMENISDLLGHGGFTMKHADIAKPLADIGAGIDGIYHLASPASPKDYSRYPLETIAANTVGTQSLLELAEKSGARFIFASTSEVYGDPEVHPQPESYWGHVRTWGPRACYDESKRLGETICYEYIAKGRVRGTVVRLFNTYGADLKPNDGRVISNMICQALNGQALTVYGDGRQTRSFSYVQDTVEGLIRVMETEAAVGEIINIGNPEEYTMLQIAEKIKEFTGAQVPIVFEPLPADDPRVRRPDIAKAKRLLAWEPQIPLTEGLRLTVEGFRVRLGIDQAAAVKDEG